ncbi:hypothetical protein WCLP8_3990003 [uncultured Gammaproteobacteria bacterium]
MAGATLTIVLTLAFTTAVGMTIARLAYMLVPGMIVTAGVVAGVAEQRLSGRNLIAFRAAVIAAVIEVALMELWKDGPISG